MQRVAVVAKLRPGAGEQAARLIELGPPFDPLTNGLERHTVFLAPDTAVFVFEGGDPQALPHVGERRVDVQPRDVFVYIIGGAKHRNPTAATGLIERLRAA